MIGVPNVSYHVEGDHPTLQKFGMLNIWIWVVEIMLSELKFLGGQGLVLKHFPNFG